MSHANCSISTHALTWSATVLGHALFLCLLISTHALTWSATRSGYHRQSYRRYFNSRAHVERDDLVALCVGELGAFQLTRSRGARLDNSPSWWYNIIISTHALTWSATRNRHRGNCGDLYFNSRAHVERDDLVALCVGELGAFQLTRSRGARRNAAPCPTRTALFQLTRSRGARQITEYRPKVNIVISTHALTWSATSSLSARSWCRSYFNSRAHVERDDPRTRSTSSSPHFNSRAHVERD